jgi:hypothetical protein
MLGLASSFILKLFNLSNFNKYIFFPLYVWWAWRGQERVRERRDKSLQNEEDELLGGKSLLLRGKKGGDMAAKGEGWKGQTWGRVMGRKKRKEIRSFEDLHIYIFWLEWARW